MKRIISIEALKDLDIAEGGLSELQVRNQRARYGVNEIVEVPGNPWLELFRETLKDPMVWFLAGISLVFYLRGDHHEALILALASLPLIFMDAVLHRRTQVSARSLRNQLASTARVLRDGSEIEINSREVVPGDQVLVRVGDFFPADGVLESAVDLQVDESTLTGEALPLKKRQASAALWGFHQAGEILVDSECLGFAGTRVLTGQGVMRVLWTGQRTTYGEIVKSVTDIPQEKTPLQKSVIKLVQNLIVAAVLFCALLAAVRIYQGHGWMDALVSAATLAVAALPEEFPIVLTFYLGVGVYRLARQKALVRRAVSVENIGRVTYICTDKTGTVTLGQLRLTHIDARAGKTSQEVLLAASVASDPSGVDPVDQALEEGRKYFLIDVPKRLRVFPFTEERKRESAFSMNSDGVPLCYMKGAPEVVMERCQMSEDEQKVWKDKTEKWASEGHKVLASAQRVLTEPEYLARTEPAASYEFCGLLAFEDPARPEVASALSYCQRNGIRVLMITGDHPATAVAIARDVGLGDGTARVLSAEAEPEKFENSWLTTHPEFLYGVDIVARCSPLQKLRIVQALHAQGELVAVTGDGVNDVPALRAADISIAMGARGTRSAREVSAIILADDNFSTIVKAIREGRQLFINLQTSFEYLVLIHIPLVVTAAVIPLLGYPILYLPLHIVWLELIIHPTALFAFQLDSHEEDPRPRRGDLFRSLRTLGVLGLLLSGVLTMSVIREFQEGGDIRHGRAGAMALLTLWSAGTVWTLTRLRGRAAKIVFSGTVLSAVLFIQGSVLHPLFDITLLHRRDWLEAIVVVLIFQLLVFYVKMRGK